MCIYYVQVEPVVPAMDKHIIDFSLAMVEEDIDLLYGEIKDFSSDEESESVRKRRTVPTRVISISSSDSEAATTLSDPAITVAVTSKPSSNSGRPTLPNKTELCKLKTCLEETINNIILKKTVS